jgi:hypothetical protein
LSSICHAFVPTKQQQQTHLVRSPLSDSSVLGAFAADKSSGGSDRQGEEEQILNKEEPYNPVAFEEEHANDPRVKELVDMAEDFDREMQPPVMAQGGAKKIITEVTLGDGKIVSDVTTGLSMNSVGDVALSTSTSSSASRKEAHPHPLKLLDGTRWRLMLNVGREPGTWMPKTWGASGDRLYLNLEMEFTEEHLYERDDFFNGVSGSKVLHVVHNEGNLAPSMMEGGRRVRIRDGGWRVVPNEGPLGTTVLRFYFDLEEETRHQGSDVYIPSGRVYCTCGYFPMAGRSGAHGEQSTKEILEKELHELEARYQKLSSQMELDDSLFSIDKIKRAKDMMDIRMEAEKIGKAVQNARVREPDRSLLRLSQDRSVGLTREGGVCCKKHKGVAVEYHILGHFEIASMENREHGDYRELLP